jgi:aminotransferase class V
MAARAADRTPDGRRLLTPSADLAAVDPICLDYNATTPVDPRVVDAMEPFLRRRFGNPSSAHDYGRPAREAVAGARARRLPARATRSRGSSAPTPARSCSPAAAARPPTSPSVTRAFNRAGGWTLGICTSTKRAGQPPLTLASPWQSSRLRTINPRSRRSSTARASSRDSPRSHPAIAEVEAVTGNAARLVRAPTLCLCKAPGAEGLAAMLRASAAPGRKRSHLGERSRGRRGDGVRLMATGGRVVCRSPRSGRLC